MRRLGEGPLERSGGGPGSLAPAESRVTRLLQLDADRARCAGPRGVAAEAARGARRGDALRDSPDLRLRLRRRPVRAAAGVRIAAVRPRRRAALRGLGAALRAAGRTLTVLRVRAVPTARTALARLRVRAGLDPARGRIGRTRRAFDAVDSDGRRLGRLR